MLYSVIQCFIAGAVCWLLRGDARVLYSYREAGGKGPFPGEHKSKPFLSAMIVVLVIRTNEKFHNLQCFSKFFNLCTNRLQLL